ncbi:universal stress protein [Streptomyces sp. NPDC006430]|uniref:universal stress protein n=1 Tax=Streptomyces sp. NPDC006430 TaxID=3154299 RepID=UPI0033A4A8EA
MTSRVTVGLDGSSQSAAAARWAAREAELRSASLDLVHAEEWLDDPLFPAATTEERQRWAEGVLHDIAAELRRDHPALEIATRRVGGLPSLALASAAKDSDMLVLGSRGLGSVAGFLVGSTGSATIAESERPVVLVRSAGRTEETPSDSVPERGPVVAGLDVGRPCDRLLAFAFEEAARRDGRLIVVHGWSLPPILSYAPALDPGVYAEMEHGIDTALDEILSPWREKFPSVTVEPRLTIGQAAIQILDAASGAALVVVGRRIRHTALGTHIGPITHAVMHHATSPVAVVAHD